MAKLVADWMTDGRTEIDHAKIDYARFYPHQMKEDFIEGRCGEAAQKIYNPAVHPREPYATGRNVKRSPFYEREKELGGYFMELGGWERAHGYAANEHLLKKYGNRVPVRENEWDNRHFWRVSNAEHLAMSEDCGIVNLSHFYMFDVEGPDHVALMEWICAAKIGGDPNIGKGIYTHFLDDEGMVRADLTVIRMADRCRVIDGADAGPRDLRYVQPLAQDKGFNVTVTDVSEKYVTIGIWGPNARATLQKVVEDPNGLTPRELPVRRDQADQDRRQERHGLPHLLCRRAGLGTAHEIRGRPRRLGCAARDRRDGVRRRDLRQQPPHGKEPAPAERRPADRIQPARSRPAAPEGQGSRLPRQGQAPGAPRPQAPARHAVHAGDDQQHRFKGRRALSRRHHAGDGPGHGETLVDELGRRSFTTSVAYGPTIGKNIALAYLPLGVCQEGRKLLVRVFRRDLSGRSRRRRLQAALRSGESEAADLTAAAT